MRKSPRKTGGSSKSVSKKKVAFRDLKANDAISVKGGVFLKMTDVTTANRDDKHKDEIGILP